MRFPIVLLNLLLSLITEIDSFKCKQLPNECRFEESFTKWSSFRSEKFICNTLNKRFNFTQTEINECKKNQSLITEVYFRLSWPEIVDASFQLTSLNEFLYEANNKLFSNSLYFGDIVVSFSNLKGFDLNSLSSYLLPSRRRKTPQSTYMFTIYDSMFDFYVNNVKLESCEDYLKLNLTRPSSLFQVKRADPIQFLFTKVRYSHKPVCPLYFDHMNITGFYLTHLVNTFYKKNYLKFASFKINSSHKLSIKIDNLYVSDLEKIDLDSASFLNKHIFHDIKKLTLFGEIRSIEKEIFKDFMSIKNFYFEMLFFEKLTQKGTDWLKSINYNLHVNISNRSQLDSNINRVVTVNLNSNSMVNIEIEMISLFRNEDFCLFRNFPFDQLVVVNVNYLYKIIEYYNASCTLQWLMQYTPIFARYLQMRKDFFFNSSYTSYQLARKVFVDFESCDFDKLAENCDYYSSGRRIYTINDFKEMSMYIEYVLIVLLPVICFLGILSNLLVICTLSLKENEKYLLNERRHYSFLRAASVSNILVLLISFFTPVYECQPFEGAYCSRFYKLVFVQYYKIVFGEFVSTVFKLLSHFIYVGFSLSRLVTMFVGQKQRRSSSSSIIHVMSRSVSFRNYLAASTIVSVVLSLVKLVRYEVNTSDPNQEYPVGFDRHFVNMFTMSKFVAKARFINVANAIVDVINYVAFVLVNLLLDTLLVVKLKRALSREHRHTRLSAMTENNNYKLLSSDVVHRAVSFTISFTIFSILLKLPASLKPLFDAIQHHSSSSSSRVFVFANDHFNYLYESLCVHSRFCATFDKLATILFLISISANVLFYFLFDKRFKISLLIAFSRIISDEKTHFEYVKLIENLKYVNNYEVTRSTDI